MASVCLQVGGFEAYVLADDEKEGSSAAEVYRQVGARVGGFEA